MRVNIGLEKVWPACSPPCLARNIPDYQELSASFPPGTVAMRYEGV